jgi:hypothetical protein
MIGQFGSGAGGGLTAVYGHINERIYLWEDLKVKCVSQHSNSHIGTLLIARRENNVGCNVTACV